MSKNTAYPFVAINMKKEFVDRIKQFVKQHPETGYRSVAQFLEDSARRRYEELQTKLYTTPRLELMSIQADNIKILDRKTCEIVHIHIQPTGMTCSCIETDDCEHITHALKIPDIRKLIITHKKEGWNVPDI